MVCFSLGWIEQLLIWFVVITAVIAIIKLLIPAVIPLGGTIIQVINIVVWVVVAIAIIILVFDLLSCVVGVPRLR
jgi:uncharacterized membrane protein